MKKRYAFLGAFCLLAVVNAEARDRNVSAPVNEGKVVTLAAPDLDRGEPVMRALSRRRSVKSFSDRPLSPKDLSDLLWAANGINRPESGKRTAPSAMNRQDVKVYLCAPEGNYVYDHKAHALVGIGGEDVRPAKAPAVLVLVTDANETWSALDAGIVSQNISLFCAGTGLATYPRATMDRGALRKALKLTEGQTLMLCHPVGYPK